MSNERSLFPILEDIENECAVPVHVLHEGDSPRNIADDTDKNGLIGFSFKDKDGNVVLPTLNEEGAIVVTADPGTCKKLGGLNATGSLTSFDLAVASLTADTDYSKLKGIGSSTRLTEHQVVIVSDVGGADTETVLATYLNGPGQYTTSVELDCFDTQGLTAPIELRLRAVNEIKEACTSAYFTYNEIL